MADCRGCRQNVKDRSGTFHYQMLYTNLPHLSFRRKQVFEKERIPTCKAEDGYTNCFALIAGCPSLKEK